VGRGLLADGLRADQSGAWPLQRPGGAPGDGVARLGGRREGAGDRGRRHLPRAADRRPAGQDLAARPVRHRAGAPARRRPAAAAVQPHPGRRRRAPAVRGQAGPRQRQAGRRGLQPPVRQRAGRRPADHVAAVRGRRPRRLRAPGRLRQRGHRHHPDGRDALPSRHGRARTCPSRCSTRTRTNRRSPCAVRSSTTSRGCPGPPRTSGTSAARRARCPSTSTRA